MRAIEGKKRIALYADYDVDGTMSCVSWIWFLKAIGHTNFVHYIPCRFKEGYGVNLTAVQHLIDDEKAELILTMDTGITANAEAALCRARGVDFICTDHHQIQPENMPDCLILNPRLHPMKAYQELCGCGITFVLLRRLATRFPVPDALWTDLLALAGMATICDVVPLNPVNHRLARMGVAALLRSQRSILRRLREAAAIESKSMDEKDVGFRLGPRINAVGRLGHADDVVRAFVDEDPGPLIKYMDECNIKRKSIQEKIVREACEKALGFADDRFLFLGGDWHPGVVGIAASKVAEKFWKPTWLFHVDKEKQIGKGSARSIAGFDVTVAMREAKDAFVKFGGHRAAGGFTFRLENEAAVRAGLGAYVDRVYGDTPDLWKSRADYDCELESGFLSLRLVELLEELKPFGNSFEEPRFALSGTVHGVDYYNDKQTGEPRHTALLLDMKGRSHKVLFFNEVVRDLQDGAPARVLVTASRNRYRGLDSLSLTGADWEVS